ncbi:MAG: pyrroloquinoline quinone-dependent dehydrogenase, partial [Acidobacteriota bacterium]
MIYKLAAAFLISILAVAQQPQGEWSAYGHDSGGTKYSPLKQINAANVGRLTVAWTYKTGDLYPGNPGRPSSQQTTPLYVDGVLYATSGFGRVIALDPDTGTKLWDFDPKTDVKAGWGDFANRGVAVWRDKRAKRDSVCSKRIYVSPIDARLFALDAKTGKPCVDFGSEGVVDLRSGLKIPPEQKSDYETTSPPAVVGDVIVMGSAIADNGRARMPSGEVRGFDARTGRLLWTWLPVGETDKTGAGNAWSILSVDEKRGWVFVPTGSPSPDYYGGNRPGDNRFANSVTALEGKTGKVVWSFQTVHHDVWDYDVASQPLLYSSRRNGRAVDAVAAGSKTGHLFLLERATGKPIFGVEERPVPQNGAAGEAISPTQPFPTMPKALVPQALKPEDAWGLTPEDRKWCADKIRSLRNDGIFTPPTEQASLIVPGNVGGMAWGGAAWHPDAGLLIVPTNRLPAMVQLIPRDKFNSERQRKDRLDTEFAPQRGTPYGMAREFLTTPQKVPCNAPPWGALTAIRTATGEVAWEVPLGSLPWLKEVPGSGNWGSLVLGGPIATGGGLVFIGGTFDPYLRALDVISGREIWKGELPSSARATPM